MTANDEVFDRKKFEEYINSRDDFTDEERQRLLSIEIGEIKKKDTVPKKELSMVDIMFNNIIQRTLYGKLKF